MAPRRQTMKQIGNRQKLRVVAEHGAERFQHDLRKLRAAAGMGKRQAKPYHPVKTKRPPKNQL